MLLLLLFVLTSHCLKYDSIFASGELRCKAEEREALLRFKKGLIDESGILSSWGSEEDKKECCKWKGINCSNETGHVTSLQLSSEFPDTQLRGNISSSLLGLSYLNHLDLSYNDFGCNEIPEFIGSLEKLQYLNFYLSGFCGDVPYQLGNLTNLRTLSLGYNELVFKNHKWLSHLSSLSLLDLSYSDLRDTNLLQNILKLPSLRELYLPECEISIDSFVKSSSTTSFDLGPSSTNLRSINLSRNYLSAIPDVFGRFVFLEYIDVSHNMLLGGIPKFFGNLSHLQTLILSENSLSEPLPELFYKLTVRANETLKILKLDKNHFNGSFPHNFGQFPRLEHMDLSRNQITGPMPDLRALVSLKELHLSRNKLKSVFPKLWQLSKLEMLDIAFNSFEGTICNVDFSKLRNLKVLDLSFNSLVLNFTIDWVPPFQLREISLARCRIGPRFPVWLQTQTNFSILDLSSAGISDEVPKWLWDLFPRMIYLNISHNQISGTVPNLSSDFIDHPVLDISYNNFSGHLPLFHPSSWILQLHNNKFLGSISSICILTYDLLIVLDLSNNQLSGELPNCWDNMTKLSILNLNNNKFFGQIPQNLGSLSLLRTLHLRDNNFSGGLPSTLKNCKYLTMIDVGGNKLTGTIPAWVGTHLTTLKFLIVGLNNFNGSIPPEICHLSEIQVLDLSRNSISGRIPQCFNNFTTLVERDKITTGYIFYFDFIDDSLIEGADFIDHALVQWKGQESQYRETLRLLKLIDLSSNRLVGNIPHEFSRLKALISLNLSRNYMSGHIISSIGEMEMLESLDLSRNQFSGGIPIGLAKLNFLAVLDLSNNNLSGKIPSSTQLQSFNASTYVENSKLCGLPLPVCPGDGPNPSIAGHGKQGKIDDGIISQGFIISVVLGFFFGFWGVVGALVVRNSWRNAFLYSFNRMKDWLYVTTTIYGARLKGNLRSIVRS